MNNYLKLQYYCVLLSKIKRANHRGVFVNAKPIFIISLLNSIEKKILQNNEIYYSTDIESEYFICYNYYSPTNTPTPLFKPYLFLVSDGFYHLEYKTREKVPFNGHSPSAKYIRENVKYARFDNALWDLLQEKECRDILRQLLIEKFLSNNKINIATMAKKYSDIIKIREQQAAYNIKNENQQDWISFIPNQQFNEVLKKVIDSVRNNNIDIHKSFWLEGTYGTGKSHAGSVIMHLLCDPIENIESWVNEEYEGHKYESWRNNIFGLRKQKRLFPVKLCGMHNISDVRDLSLVLQREITDALQSAGISISVQTDFDNYIEHITKNEIWWDDIIDRNEQLKSVTPNRQKLIAALKSCDTSVLEKVVSAWRDRGADVRIKSTDLPKWIVEVQNKLAEQGTYDGFFIVWDEFTSIVESAVGIKIITELQHVNELLMKTENNSYFFFIAHQSALKSLHAEERQKTKGRYCNMLYNMEPVSAIKIMSRKFKPVDEQGRVESYNLASNFYKDHHNLLNLYSNLSNNPEETRNDLMKLFPIHPTTAQLATFYAREVGSSSRSVFEFIGQNQAVKDFLGDEEHYKHKDTITADYLWDYVLDEFNRNTQNYGAVTERFNSFKNHVESQGYEYFAVFKGILLLNAFNNLIGANNNSNEENVVPSVPNIKNMFVGTSIESKVDDVLVWLDEKSIIQRQPTGNFSIQFNALPSDEISKERSKLENQDYKFTFSILRNNETANKEFDIKFKGVFRPMSYKFYSVDVNETTLANKIYIEANKAKKYELFFALFFSRNYAELNEIKVIAEKFSKEERFKNIVFVVFDSVLEDKNYNRFIEYEANASVALNHGFASQKETHKKNSSDLLRVWISDIIKNNFSYYFNGLKDNNSASKFASTINACVAPIIFNNGPESLHLIQTTSSQTYWKKENKKQIVNDVLQYNTKSEIESKCTSNNVHMKFLLQDSVEEDLNWKVDVDKEHHPLYIISHKIKSTFDHINKNETFNLAEKLQYLTEPPYGLYQSAAGMGMVAFAMRRYVKQIFDLNGKPRDQKQLSDDIVAMFSAWENGKIDHKLEFRFETKEQRNLCDTLVKTFQLNKLPQYGDISSLNDTRWAITHAYAEKKGYPLWAIKYYPNNKQEEVASIIENVIRICNEQDMRNTNLISNTLHGLQTYKFELGNVLHKDDAFKKGFENFLKQVENVNIQDSEIEDALSYLKSHLGSEVGMWAESEVENQLKNWRLSQTTKKEIEISVGVTPYGSGQVVGGGKFETGTIVHLAAVPNDGYEFECWADTGETNPYRTFEAEYNMDINAKFREKVETPEPKTPVSIVPASKKQSVKNKIKSLNSVDSAKNLLEKIVDSGDKNIIDIIDNEL